MIYYTCSRVFSHFENFLHHLLSTALINPLVRGRKEKNMLPEYLRPGYAEKMQRISEELKANLPRFARSEYEAKEIKAKEEREIQRRHNEEFKKRASEIGYMAALLESSQEIDSAIAEAKSALEDAVVYKK